MAELLSFLENAPPGSPWRTALDSSPTPPASGNDWDVPGAEMSSDAEVHRLYILGLHADLLAEESGWGDHNSGSCSRHGSKQAAIFTDVPLPRGKARRSRQSAPMTKTSPESQPQPSTNRYSVLMSKVDGGTGDGDSDDGGGMAEGEQGGALKVPSETSAPRLKRKKGAQTGAPARALTLAAAAFSTPVAFV